MVWEQAEKLRKGIEWAKKQTESPIGIHSDTFESYIKSMEEMFKELNEEYHRAVDLAAQGKL